MLLCYILDVYIYIYIYLCIYGQKQITLKNVLHAMVVKGLVVIIPNGKITIKREKSSALS